jgi:hypothetical protein
MQFIIIVKALCFDALLQVLILNWLARLKDRWKAAPVSYPPGICMVIKGRELRENIFVSV